MAPESAVPPFRWKLLALHVVVVLALLVGYYAIDIGIDPEDGTNAGKGLPALLLIAPGLPWSLVVWSETWGTEAPADLRFQLSAFGPAVINVLLHAAYRFYQWRLRTDAPSELAA